MTVSRVVNGEPSVGDAIRGSVNAAIQQLNYTPNLAARSLVTAEHLKIGVVCSDHSSAFLSEVLVGVLDASQAAAAQVLLSRWDESRPHEAEVVHRLVRGGASGVVLLPPYSESDIFREAVAHADLPAAVVAPGRTISSLICVRLDDERAAYDVGHLLLGLGHRRVGMIGGSPDHASSHARRAGFEAAMAEAPSTEVLFEQGFYNFTSGLVAAEALLSGPHPPSAIFACNDDMAAAVISVAHRRGLNVPGHLSVVGFDDTATAPALWPPLTTVRQPVREMAASAVTLLVRRIRTRDLTSPADQMIDYEIIERQSVGPPAS